MFGVLGEIIVFRKSVRVRSSKLKLAKSSFFYCSERMSGRTVRMQEIAVSTMLFL